jgi:hypothetical protein
MFIIHCPSIHNWSLAITFTIEKPSVLGVTVDLRHFHVLCLLAFKVFGWRNLMSTFVVFHLLGQLGNTKEVIHSLERKALGLRDAV